MKFPEWWCWKWSFPAQSHSIREDNSPNTCMKSAVTHTHLFLAFHPSVFLPLMAVHFCPFKNERNFGIKLPAWSRLISASPNLISWLRPTHFFYFIFLLNYGAIPLTFSCRNACLVHCCLLWHKRCPVLSLRTSKWMNCLKYIYITYHHGKESNIINAMAKL